MMRKLGIGLLVILMLQTSLNSMFGRSDAVVHADTVRTAYETSFDDPTDTTWLMHASSYDTAEKHSGTHSLKYVTPEGPNNANEEGAEREAAYIRFPANPGSAYDTSIWIKTTQLAGLWAGAMVRIAFYDANGKRLEKYNNNPLNSLDKWQKVSLPTLVAGEKAAVVEIAVFAYGGEGTMWFDDLVVTESQPPLFTSKLDTPNYRGYLIPGGNAEVKVVTRGAVGIPVSQYTTQAKLMDAQGQVAQQLSFPGQLGIEAVFDTSGLPAGNYKVVIDAVRTADGEVLYSEQWPIHKVAAAADLPKSYVDDQGRFWKDGELFFPIGFYAEHIVKKDLEDLLGSAINTLMPYNYPDEEKLDLAHDYGMNVIFSLKDFFHNVPYAPEFIKSEADEVVYIKQFVEKYKNHPALLAWYLNDESPSDKRQPAHYQAVVETDPDHPAYIVDYRKVDPYVVHLGTDIYGVDMYPVYGKADDDFKRVSDLQKAMTADLGKKGQWAVVQAHNLGNYESDWGATRGPSTEEMRNMSWQYIAEGAKGILFYSLFDLVNDASGKTYEELLGNVKVVAQELENMAPVILSSEVAPQVDYSAQDWLNVMVSSYNGNWYIVAVNNSKVERQASFTLPAANASERPIQVWNEERSLDWSGQTFTDTLAPLAVHIYEIGKAESIPGPQVPEWEAGASLALSEISQNSVKLSWPEAENAPAAYRIYIDGKPSGEVSGSELSFVVSGLTANTAYTFTVTAVNAHGNESRGLSKEGTTLPVPSSGGGSGWFPSGDTALASIAIVVDGEALQLTPPFTAAGEEYYAETEAAYADIKATPSHAAAHITLDGKALKPELRVELTPGLNTFELIIEAENKTQRTIKVIINQIAEEEVVPEPEPGPEPGPSPEQEAEALIDIEGHWAEEAIRQAIESGLVQGYPDHSFRPDNSITRAEFIVMLMNQLQHLDQASELAFTDSGSIGEWAASAIARAVEAGIIQGYADGSFRPSKAISRVEMAAILSRALQVVEQPVAATSFADDQAIPAWGKASVQAMHKLGLVQGRNGNRFAPLASLTRAESVVIMLRLIDQSL